ncbi:hypothetical protein FHT98_0622 [Bosea sp. AK1]|nr:hypothetical protein FHT98_0622 [Bosea sp. AK1]
MSVNSAMTDNEMTERLDRLQQEVGQLRDIAIIQTVILQALALKAGIAPQHLQAASPVPIPPPGDLMDMLNAKD